MKPIYMLDAKTYLVIKRACAALAREPERAEVLAPIIAAMLERATRADLEIDRPSALQ
jgi:hypothetical protein